jgi:hypothetical protein
VNDRNLAETFSEPSGPSETVGRLRALSWEDVIWLFILSGLATLWIFLLMSPSWR